MSKLVKIWAPLLVYAAAIYIQSAFAQLVPIPRGWDKAVHFFEFALLGFLVARVIFLSGNFHRWSGILFAWILATGWGILDEFHQSFVPGRSASTGDAVADGLGALVGAVLFIYLGLWLYKNEKLYPRKSCGV